MNQQNHQHQHHGHKKVNYPVRFGFINKIDNWWPPEKIAANIGVPEFSNYHMYNYIALAFWTFNNGPVDIALLWSDPMKFFGNPNPFGASKDEAQKNLKAKYNKEGIKLMVAAFGSTEMPTTNNIDPIACAGKLGQFVLQNNLDGVDIDWQDNNAMQNGTGEQWLITFTQRLRSMLPHHTITHSPQAPYFSADRYKNGGYVNVNQQVGNLIDFYNVQFYNQGDTTYNTYEKLFVCSGGHFPGTSVKEISQKGVPLEKIVVGKPVTTADCYNTGHMDHQALGNSLVRAYNEGQWYAGAMLWQFQSDKGGEVMKTVCSQLKQLYDSKH